MTGRGGPARGRPNRGESPRWRRRYQQPTGGVNLNSRRIGGSEPAWGRDGTDRPCALRSRHPRISEGKDFIVRFVGQIARRVSRWPPAETGWRSEAGRDGEGRLTIICSSPRVRWSGGQRRAVQSCSTHNTRTVRPPGGPFVGGEFQLISPSRFAGNGACPGRQAGVAARRDLRCSRRVVLLRWESCPHLTWTSCGSSTSPNSFPA